jgi:hypothetical protein
MRDLIQKELKMGKSSEYYFNDCPICPYCEEAIDFISKIHDEDIEIECDECGKKLLCSVHVEYTFSTRKINE